MTREANPFLGRSQADRGHVALRLHDVTDGARRRHRRMHGFPHELTRMTGRAFSSLADGPRMLHCKRGESDAEQSQHYKSGVQRNRVP